MTPFLMALLAQAAPPVSMDTQFADCASLAKSDPTRAAQAAEQWRLKGGGLYARRCQALAFVALERWVPAATAFEQAARDAQAERDPAAADLWVQAGNAWLAADDATKARGAIDAALTAGTLTGELRGEAHLDRARAGVALGDLAGARADFDKALELVPQDPFAWYLSSALALRQGDLAAAKTQAGKALELAPDDADLLLHAGNVAGSEGNATEARAFYERATKAAPESDAGKAAAAALAANTDQPK